MIKEEIMKNFFQGYGMVSNAPKISETPRGNIVCNFHLKIREDKADGSTKYIIVPVEAWNKVAEEFFEKAKRGTFVAVIDGKLKRKFFRTEKNSLSYIHDGLCIVARKIEILEEEEIEEYDEDEEDC